MVLSIETDSMEYFSVFDNLISPRLTYRAENEGSTNYENCFFESNKTLEQYYDDMEGADNPFSEITIRGQKGEKWKWTGSGNLKLIHNNLLARSGAARLKVKSGYAVKLRISVGEEDFILGKQDERPVVIEQSALVHNGKSLTRRERRIGRIDSEWDEVIEWPVVGRDDAPLWGKEQVDVVLVGSCGDYLDMDLEGQWEGIGKFHLKLCDDLYKNSGTSDINGNSWVEVLGVCKIEETSEIGGNVKIEEYRGYPIWRDETSDSSLIGPVQYPYKIVVKDKLSGLIPVFTQGYTQRTEASGAINMAKAWIDNKLNSNGGGNGENGENGGNGGNGENGGNGGNGGDGENGGNGGDGGDDSCPDNSSLKETGICECDSGYELDSATMTCVEKEDSFSTYIIVGGLALLGLALLG